MIRWILETAIKIRTPLALSGFTAALFFLLARQMVSKMPKPKQEAGVNILRLSLVLFFVLSMTAMMLGFAGYVVDRIPSVSNMLPDPTARTITGIVRENSLEQAPIPGATVSIDEKMLSVPSNPDGTFSIPLSARNGESFLIRASAKGFAETTKWVRVGEFASLSLDRKH